ncbi:MAG: DUF2851 family protein [Saprospiraceae bacterium]|nr:DUF2851 family protein [Saprospiraceae bacterium]
MREHFLSFVWQHKLFAHDELKTTEGQFLSIIHSGYLNHDAGPDFREARVKLDDILWSGNVEIHVRSSDWQLHGHESDPAYDNVILHVVYEDDRPVIGKAGSPVPCLELKRRLMHKYIRNWKRLETRRSWLPCGSGFADVKPATRANTMERMTIERLESRTFELLHRLEQVKGDWTQLIFERLSRGMGFGKNGEAFEQMARSIPSRILMKASDSHLTIEAILFGQQGLLKDPVDNYQMELRSTYDFLRQKYGIEPLGPGRLKFLRTRPSNFPTVRLSQLAALISRGSEDFSHFLEVTDWNEVRAALQCQVSPYWQRHYDFGKSCKQTVRALSLQSQQLLTINVLVPLQFAYATYLGSEVRKANALSLLGGVSAENNKIIRKWRGFGAKPKNGLDTQGLLHLHGAYCSKHRCLACPVGSELIRKMD